MDSNNDTKYKYLYNKYKNKYLSLKSQIGGNQILIHVKDKPSDSKSRIMTNDLPNLGETFHNTFNKQPYLPAYKPLENARGIVYETGKLLEGKDIGAMSGVLVHSLKNPVVNIAVEQPVFDDFRRLCALSKDTKIFNKCSDIYADNKP